MLGPELYVIFPLCEKKEEKGTEVYYVHNLDPLHWAARVNMCYNESGRVLVLEGHHFVVNPGIRNIIQLHAMVPYQI